MAKATRNKKLAEVVMDVRIMDTLVNEETSDLTGIKNDEESNGVENRVVANKRRKMGQRIEVTGHSLNRDPPSGERSPAHTPPPKDQDKGRLQMPLEGALAAKSIQGTKAEDPKDKSITSS